MTMDEVIRRINELAKKAKNQGLTPGEEQERAQLRQRYLDSVRQNLRAQLDHTYIVEPDGTRHKLNRK